MEANDDNQQRLRKMLKNYFHPTQRWYKTPQNNRSWIDTYDP